MTINRDQCGLPSPETEYVNLNQKCKHQINTIIQAIGELTNELSAQGGNKSLRKSQLTSLDRQVHDQYHDAV